LCQIETREALTIERLSCCSRTIALAGNLALVPIYAQQRITVFIRDDAKDIPATDVPADHDTDEHNQEQRAAQAEQDGICAIGLCPNGAGNQ